MGARTGIALAMHAGDETAVPVYQRGGLALHRAPRGHPTWTITHAVSGQAVVQWIPSERKGRRLLRLLLGLTDWTASEAEVCRRVTRAQIRPLWREAVGQDSLWL